METLTYQPYLDRLIEFATSEEKKQELLAAKAEYFQLTGEVHEDDKSFDMRMAAFLDWYLFDRPAPASGRTPAAEFCAARSEGLPAEEQLVFRGFTETLHGLFEVRKLGKGVIRLRELHGGKDFDVTERRQVAGLEKGDVIEARLIPLEGHLLFSAAFVWHPREGRAAIFKELKRRKKKEPDRDRKDLVWDTSRMALKVERYRQIPVERIYDFQQTKL